MQIKQNKNSNHFKELKVQLCRFQGDLLPDTEHNIHKYVIISVNIVCQSDPPCCRATVTLNRQTSRECLCHAAAVCARMWAGHWAASAPGVWHTSGSAFGRTTTPSIPDGSFILFYPFIIDFILFYSVFCSFQLA